MLIGMVLIVRRRNPFQVEDGCVSPVGVNMINLSAMKRRLTQKCDRYEPMNKLGAFASRVAEIDTQLWSSLTAARCL